MSYLQIDDPLWLELDSICRDEGLALYDVERAGASILKIYLLSALSSSAGVTGEGVSEGNARANGFTPVAGTAVTSGDCSRLCRRLMVFFHAEGVRFGLSPEPQLEVTSPGVNRNLRLPGHIYGAIGERIKVVLREKPAGVPEKSDMVVLGKLEKFIEGVLTISDEHSKTLVDVSLENIKRAHVDFKF